MAKEENKVEEPTTQEQPIPSPQQEEQKDNEIETKMAELTETIKKLEEDNKNLVEKVKLAQAETINYRVRKDEEVANQLKYANKDIIQEIIPVIDNFERAIASQDDDASEEMKKHYAGVKMIYSGLVETLKKFGVETIERVGEIFDPTQEQALLTDSDPSKQDEEVLEVLLKGYKLKDRVIRPASVKINQL